MAGVSLSGPAPEAESPFRPSKRRKMYRRRGGDDEDEDEKTEPTAAPEEAEGTPSASSVAEIRRLRKQQARPRRGVGIEFSTASSRAGLREPGPLVRREKDETAPEEIPAVAHRFAPQTGQVADVNKHMMAFIDVELTKRLHGGGTAPAAASSEEGGALRTPGEATAQASSTRQPASLGKLHEIDLGPSSTLSNIARTEAARRRLDNGEPAEQQQPLGRNGKPWRGRRRRTSEDVRRDQLVEEVLRESRLEIYNEPLSTAAGDPDEPAGEQEEDDRIAEAFRREFLDAVSSRQRRRPAAPPTSAASSGPGGKNKDADRPKGPKLGGSRSARAAMREALEKGGKK
ncbi:MAG: hypothetical protein M1832_002364 [Thelocarpon impressellum]|nr:MAG: hypothetical protein M1832_002364 [Thelocarpon impressellum]